LIIAIACIIALAVVASLLGVRSKDLPEPEPVSPFDHLDERKAAIYENLRDLQFEYRVGKLSDQDYQHTKKDLQKELAAVRRRRGSRPIPNELGSFAHLAAPGSRRSLSSAANAASR
jgi:hypothetical protein